METSEVITFGELDNGIELESDDSKFKTCAKLLIAALNDWPTLGLQEPSDLLNELRDDVNKPLTFDNLHSYLRRLTIQDAWKMEAVASLLEMFDFDRDKSIDKTMTLETIIKKLTDHYRAER
jgi:hypothetical protein